MRRKISSLIITEFYENFKRLAKEKKTKKIRGISKNAKNQEAIDFGVLLQFGSRISARKTVMILSFVAMRGVAIRKLFWAGNLMQFGDDYNRILLLIEDLNLKQK